MGGHLDPLAPKVFEEAEQRCAGPVIGNRRPEASELGGRRHVQARPHSQRVGGQ